MNPDPTAPADFVRLFTDGACSGNPGPGGWAYILQHPASGRISDGSGAESATTNNRMELMGAIEGLASLKRRCQVELVTDSTYVGKGLSEWMPKWKSQGWRRKEGQGFKPVVNLDLWQRLDELLAKAIRSRSRSSWATTATRRTRPATGWRSPPTSSWWPILGADRGDGLRLGPRLPFTFGPAPAYSHVRQQRPKVRAPGSA